MEKIENILNDNLDWKDEEIRDLREDRDFWRKKFDTLLDILIGSNSKEITIIQNNK